VPATSASAAQVTIENASVTPKRFFFDSATQAEVRFTIQAPAAADLVVRFVHGDEDARSFQLPDVVPGTEQLVSWNGVGETGKPAPDGAYSVVIGEAGGPAKNVGKVTLRGHFFPVRGPHGTRGPIGDFGAPRSGGRTHQGFDVVASCGTPLVAARGGTVVRKRFDPALDGNFVVIAGRKEGLTYRYSHLIEPTSLEVGDRVRTGDPVGRVGKTGNAISVGCHLHFEMRRSSKRFIDPEPFLRAWDRFS
jgi:murein DD-endopeptidase MepM/ murein hydrolase activator NlpD